MSSPGDITPQLPGTVPVNKPLIPSLNPPNVNGGNATFSTSTDAIADLVKAKQAELNASSDALLANTSVDKSVAGAIAGYQKDTLDAYDKVQRANQIPGGATGGLARIIGLFDSDYNLAFQKTKIEENTLRSQSIQATGAAIKEQNNQLPLLMGKVSEASQAIFTAQTQANELILKQSQLDLETRKAKLEAIETGIHMSQEARTATEFKIRGMSTDQITGALAQAKAGKGPFKNQAGLLQSRLLEEQSAETSLARSQIELQKGNRENANAAMVDAVSHIPVDTATSLLANAQKNNMPYVALPTGEKDAKGQPVTANVPLDIFQQGIVQSNKVEQEYNTQIAAGMTDRLGIVPSLTNLNNGLNAFSFDPRAAQLLPQLGAIAQNIDAKNPSNIKQSAILIKGAQDKFDQIVKDNAAAFTTPDAKAAVLNYGKSGKFDAVGGTAVVGDSVGQPITRTSLYSDAWTVLNNVVVTGLKAQHVVNTSTTGGSNSAADTMQAFAAALQKPQGREKISQIAAEALADPANQKAVADSIKGTIQVGAVNNVISGLAHQKDANPIWTEIDQHYEKFMDSKNQVDPQKLFEYLEQKSVLTGGKANYANVFLTGLHNYAVNADNTPASDPSYTIQDHALEASIFGSAPHSAVLGSLHYSWRIAAQRAHKEMQARIQQDLNGQTVAGAVKNATIDSGSSMDTGGGFGSFLNADPQTIYKKTGLDITSVPSATGTGMTVSQIQKMYLNGVQ
jgi:hypothetical protein